MQLSGNRGAFMKPEEFALLLYIALLFFGAGYIHQTYIAGPKKSFREGIRDWIDESADDI